MIIHCDCENVRKKVLFCFCFFSFFQVWKGIYIMRNDDKSMDDGGGETTIIHY